MSKTVAKQTGTGTSQFPIDIVYDIGQIVRALTHASAHVGDTFALIGLGDLPEDPRDLVALLGSRSQDKLFVTVDDVGMPQAVPLQHPFPCACLLPLNALFIQLPPLLCLLGRFSSRRARVLSEDEQHERQADDGYRQDHEQFFQCEGCVHCNVSPSRMTRHSGLLEIQCPNLSVRKTPFSSIVKTCCRYHLTQSAVVASYLTVSHFKQAPLPSPPGLYPAGKGNSVSNHFGL